MLGSPCLLFPLSSLSPREVDYVNDIHSVVQARVRGSDYLAQFIAAEGFFYAAFAVMNLNLGTWVMRAALVGVGVGVIGVCSTYDAIIQSYSEILWSRFCELPQPQQSFVKASELTKAYCEWQGECEKPLPGIHWPRSALKYRDNRCNHVILVADQAHRYLSVFWFGVAGVAAFSLLSPVHMALYSVYMGALFLFQQEGLRIYPKSPRLYHLLDITFKGGALFVAVCHTELLFFSCRLTQMLFIAYIILDAIYSLPMLLFGEGCSLKLGRD